MTILQSLKHSITKRFDDPLDVYGAVKPLYNICTLFGLAPYNLIRLENGRKMFKSAWFPLVKNSILALLILGFAVYHAIFERKPFRDSEDKEKMRYGQELSSSLLCSCAMIFGCIFSKKIIEVFKIVDEVDVSFRSLAVWIPYKGVYVRIIFHMIGLFILMFFLIMDRFCLVSFIYEDEMLNLYTNLTTFITLLLPYIINLLMEFQYCHYLNLLRIRYKFLNEYLEALVQENKTYAGWFDEDIVTISDDTKKLKKQLLVKEKKIPKSLIAISDPVFIVEQVAALHIKLTDAAHMINFAFCVQQLLRITVAFISIVAALFLLAINFSKSSANDGESQLDYFFTAWAFSNACEVMGIVWITSETCDEANTCPRILHKIRNNTNNVNLQDTIEIYSLQMYHNRLSFTVCGLFPLDYTLLYTIVAGVTTYLVILIQFNNADFVKKPLNSTLAMLNATVE